MKKENVLLLNYFIGYLLIYPFILSLLGLAEDVYVGSFLAGALTLFVVIKIGYNTTLKQGVEKIKQIGWKSCILHIALGLFFLFTINIVCGSIINSVFNVETSANQTGVVSGLNTNNILITSVLIVFMMPVVEEMTFRYAMLTKLKKLSPVLKIIIASLLFGFIHVSVSFFQGNWIDCVYVIVYSLMGVVFNVSYIKADTICMPIILHSVYNLIALILVFF